MKVTKTEIRFKTGFQQPKTGLPKKPVLTSLILSFSKDIRIYVRYELIGRPKRSKISRKSA